MTMTNTQPEPTDQVARPMPCRWQVVVTDAGPHVRLVGANGEVVLWSETYSSNAAAVAAIRLAQNAAQGWDVLDLRKTP